MGASEAATPTTASPPEGKGKRGRRFTLPTWRVRPRLVALIIIPTVAAVLLGGMRVTTALRTADDYRRLTQLALLVQQLGSLNHELALERDLMVWYIARPAGPGRKEAAADQTKISNRIGEQVATSIGSLDPGQKLDVVDSVTRVERWLNGLEGLRDIALSAKGLTPIVTVQAYSAMIDDIRRVYEALSNEVTDADLRRQVLALTSVSEAKEEMSRQRALLVDAIVTGRANSDTLTGVLGSVSAQQTAITNFQARSSIEDLHFYAGTVSGPEVTKAEAIKAQAVARLRQGLRTGVTDPRQWFSSATATIDRMRTVEQRLEGEVLAGSRQQQQNERQTAITLAVSMLVLLLIVFAVTLIVVRSLIRPLRQLRREALYIAGQSLPQTVQKVRELDGGAAAGVEVTPIRVSAKDEIGEVARAFDEVHREAVRLAAQEAALRTNVNAMFVNLSRRSQSLVERQLSLIDGLEQGEEDEERLAHLFRLDHLATRMRRNSENLLVLAGQEPARRWSQPIPVIDVVRAALSEVEGYERVTMQIISDVSVVGGSVNDGIHLIAELVENAISFSPPQTKVTISTNRIDGGGLMISISDRGIGITGDELSIVNYRLANPPEPDVSVSRRMGLFVVARLAYRHGVRVQLRQQDGGGVTAMVLLPENLLVGAGANQPQFGQPQFGQQPFGQPQFGQQPFGQQQPVPAQQPFGQPSAAAQQPFGQPPVAAQPFGSPPAFGQQPFPSDPFAQPIPSDPFSQPIPSDPFSQPFPSDPFAQPVASDPFAQPVASDPFAQPLGPDHSGPHAWGEPQQPAMASLSPASAPPDNFTHVRRFNRKAHDEDATGPLPQVGIPSMDNEEEFLPIFSAVESDWFRKRRGEDVQWDQSPADHGWQVAAATFTEPALGGVTTSGLPKRQPKANLIPGSVNAAAAAAAPAPEPPRPPASPDAVRNRLSSFQRGLREGRAALRNEEPKPSE
ncbi:nitrate- and nitrite sensing domain-containing protein [Planotetraspora sp. A-T 1434]|uniref:sensor histidine kinase n=1 Tax=Planotetraspora sp. A-T 1434 TaxID=2979219 RepID=UPI0021C149DA|nr:nitrate- and nitrite sensing domain-containing protein [Planotetraspora sp. A-T 1434]MCT9929195.1 nitrate- and nitrite sensing domain-containing protein [Planotetraspora sp. A-T 1434]